MVKYQCFAHKQFEDHYSIGGRRFNAFGPKKVRYGKNGLWERVYWTKDIYAFRVGEYCYYNCKYRSYNADSIKEWLNDLYLNTTKRRYEQIKRMVG